MLNKKVSIHIAITCLTALLYVSIASAECVQETITGETLPACKPAASAPCYVVGGHGEICASEPANRFAVSEWRPEYTCYAKYGRCERDDNGQCGWIDTEELSQCIADMQRGFQESVQPCTICPIILNTGCPPNNCDCK